MSDTVRASSKPRARALTNLAARQKFWEQQLLAESQRLLGESRHRPAKPQRSRYLSPPINRQRQLVNPTADRRGVNPDRNELINNLLNLQRGLTGNRRLIGSGYLDDQQHLAAYLAFYWLISYTQVRGILLQAKAAVDPVLFRARSIRILDIGAGPGPGGLAVADWHKVESQQRQTKGSESTIKITALDRSSLALASARRLAATTNYAFKAYSPWLADRDPLPEGGYDYIVMSHFLNELTTNNQPPGQPTVSAVSFIKTLQPKLSDKGLLIIIEPALTEFSRAVTALRDHLVAAGWRTLAPCTHNQACPALQLAGQSCHSVFHWPAPLIIHQLAASLGLDKSVAKASAFALAPPSGNYDSLVAGPNIIFGAASQTDKTLFPDGEYFRVVSDPLLNKAGRVRLLICGRVGRMALSCKPNETLPAATVFFQLRRSDLICLKLAQVRHQGLTLGPETSLKVESG